MRKPAFCICENKEADQLHGNREADRRLCFHYMDSTIPLLSKASSHRVWLYNRVCVGPGRKPRRPVFSQRGSYDEPFHMSCISRKPVFGISNQVGHKLDFKATEDGLRLEILDLESRGIVLPI